MASQEQITETTKELEHSWANFHTAWKRLAEAAEDLHDVMGRLQRHCEDHTDSGDT